MQPIRFVDWQEGDFWLGYLDEFPDYWTQGTSRGDLVAYLKDLYSDLTLTGGHIPGARQRDRSIADRRRRQDVFFLPHLTNPTAAH